MLLFVSFIFRFLPVPPNHTYTSNVFCFDWFELGGFEVKDFHCTNKFAWKMTNSGHRTLVPLYSRYFFVFVSNNVLICNLSLAWVTFQRPILISPSLLHREIAPKRLPPSCSTPWSHWMQPREQFSRWCGHNRDILRTSLCWAGPTLRGTAQQIAYPV